VLWKPTDSDLGSFLMISLLMFLMIFCMKILIFSMNFFTFLYENLRFPL